jgi:probable F420-dependent oxidoreductase
MEHATMEFGLYVPTRGSMATRAGYAALARRAEELGFDILAVSDHVVIPSRIDSTYPYTLDGHYPGREECLEQLTILATLAALTTRTRLLTSVMVVPHRPAVLAAKALASIDVLSEGRLVLGCGTGWMEEEFRALGAPPLAERGRVTDEYIAAFRELWTKDAPRFDGKYVKFSGITFLPKPVQKPTPPIWIGGESGPALRRAAKLGDGWYPIGDNPRCPLDTLARYRDGVAGLAAAAGSAGRDPKTIDLAYWAYSYSSKRRDALDGGGRALFSGEPKAIVDDIHALAEIGVGHLVFTLLGATLDQTLANMDRFANDVMSKARS